MVSLPPGKRLSLAVRAALSAAGLAPSGCFIPCRWAGDLRPIDYPAVARLLAAHEANFQALLRRIEDYAETFDRFDGPPPAPRFGQDWFPRLDAAAAYTIVREMVPRRIVEIGCGHSTRFLARAAADGGIDCEIICIDPAPRATLTGLPVRHLACRLQQAPVDIITALAAGDILFVDSSHLALPGSDVDHLFHRILPELPAGVLLHLHDIFLPDPYPAEWAWRGYGEQLLLASWLLAGGLEPVFASHWVMTRMQQLVADSPVTRLPMTPGVYESSFWARTRQGPPAGLRQAQATAHPEP